MQLGHVAQSSGPGLLRRASTRGIVVATLVIVAVAPLSVAASESLSHSAAVRGVAFSPDGRYALSASDDHTIIVWDVFRLMPVRVLRGHKDSVLRAVFSEDGSKIISGSADHTFIQWNAATGVALTSIRAHQSGIRALAFSPNGTRALSMGTDDTLRVWELLPGRLLREWPVRYSITAISFLPNGDEVAFGQSRTIGVVNVLTEKSRISMFRFGHSMSVTALGVSADGRYAVSGSLDNTATVWEIATERAVGEPLRTLHGHAATLSALAVSPTGRYAVSGDSDRAIILWDLATGALIRRLHGPLRSITALAFSPDGSVIVAGSADAWVHFWPVSELLARRELPARERDAALTDELTRVGDSVQKAVSPGAYRDTIRPLVLRLQRIIDDKRRLREEWLTLQRLDIVSGIDEACAKFTSARSRQAGSPASDEELNIGDICRRARRSTRDLDNHIEGIAGSPAVEVAVIKVWAAYKRHDGDMVSRMGEVIGSEEKRLRDCHRLLESYKSESKLRREQAKSVQEYNRRP